MLLRVVILRFCPCTMVYVVWIF
eukprot:SAG11_NODE_33268_length_278_cov_0.849162_2_plen_22_part_01